jgi:hypothetical protein
VNAAAYEKLGVFYLGRVFDPETGGARPDLLLYEAKDLTTHAVIVGMTGSGKTGLGVALLEEAALDGIPAIVIDPKGDLGNLALAFPELRAEDFRPWIDEAEAARKGRTADEHAAETAAAWTRGLAEWDQDPERIRRLRDAAEVAIYTPGSNAGLPLSVLRSLDAPPASLADDADALRERVSAVVSGILALVGIEADPLRSREHVLVATIVDRAWRAGESLDLGALVRLVQTPPFDRVGVLDVESFFPARERTSLATALNAVLASPGFAAWAEGEPLDVARLLWTREGKPRLSVLSIAHLSDAERMFFVSVLLAEVLAWVRTQPGTSSLRAILYMDEVFGFFPPTANPPSKTPMLSLLKQARAYGLGVVLATQNPVDLDYKGLSNAGTWFLGRLQTERDKARVLDGLEGASAASGTDFDRARTEATLSGLKSRVFLMNDVHEDAPVVFQSRFALSYLRGPMTRNEIRALAARSSSPADVPPSPAPASRAPVAAGSARPAVGPDVTEVFLGGAPIGAGAPLRPALLGSARIRWHDAKAKIDHASTVTVLAPLGEAALDDPWTSAQTLEREPVISRDPPPAASWGALPGAAARAKSYGAWSKALAEHLRREATLDLLEHPELRETSRPDEAEGDFRARVALRLREARDLEVVKIERAYAPKLESLQERIRRAEERVERERSQASRQTMQTAISVGATVLGALFGRKLGSLSNVGRATTAARGLGRAAEQRADVARAAESAEELRGKLADLERELESELTRVRATVDPRTIPLERRTLRPRKSDVEVVRVVLAWRS